MTKQDPRNKPAKPQEALDDAQLDRVTGGNTSQATQSNLTKKISDTSSGIVSNIK